MAHFSVAKIRISILFEDISILCPGAINSLVWVLQCPVIWINRVFNSRAQFQGSEGSRDGAVVRALAWPTNVAWLRFPVPVSYVGWVCCWFSSLLRGFYSGFSGFPPSIENQHFQIPIPSACKARQHDSSFTRQQLLNVMVQDWKRNKKHVLRPFKKRLFDLHYSSLGTCFQNTFKTRLKILHFPRSSP